MGHLREFFRQSIRRSGGGSRRGGAPGRGSAGAPGLSLMRVAVVNAMSRRAGPIDRAAATQACGSETHRKPTGRGSNGSFSHLTSRLGSAALVQPTHQKSKSWRREVLCLSYWDKGASARGAPTSRRKHGRRVWHSNARFSVLAAYCQRVVCWSTGKHRDGAIFLGGRHARSDRREDLSNPSMHDPEAARSHDRGRLPYSGRRA